MRPVGALIFGRAAEKFGRKPILMLNIVFFSAFEPSCHPYPDGIAGSVRGVQQSELGLPLV